ncbi:MAG: mitochondrial fission ELM1 family protein [Thiogranum sp.]
MNESVQGDASRPLTWVLTGYKAGDNAQVLALADALGWRYDVKRFNYRKTELLTNRLLAVTLAGIDKTYSSALSPPWPDLIITAGRRNEPVARWIRKQAGGRTRLVHVGRPWAPLDVFDLIITTPQYFLPDRQNVLKNYLPLHGVMSGRLNEAADAWRQRLAHLPRPCTAVLIGGDSGPFVFTGEKGQRLGQLVNSMALHGGGSLLVTDSARTPGCAFEAFQRELSVPAYIHHWTEAGDANPYLAYLALADQLVVTGESMSMLTEASFTCKPLYIFDPGDTRPWWRHGYNFRYKPLSHRLAMLLAARRMHRDVGNIQRQLVASGRAVWLGHTFPAGKRAAPPDDAQLAAMRVRALFES